MAGITHVSMDTSATYARAARLALPHATVVVDRFHLVALANRAVTEYRRELAWARRGRRGRKCDPEWTQRNRLLRAAETLTSDELARVREAMRRGDPTGGLEKCWQGKEMLRDLLKLAGTTPDRGRIWNALTDFYIHCADSGVAQLRRLAWPSASAIKTTRNGGYATPAPGDPGGCQPAASSPVNSEEPVCGQNASLRAAVSCGSAHQFSCLPRRLGSNGHAI